MADQPGSEMFMQFVTSVNGRPGSPLCAECAAEKDKKDPLMLDFNPAPVDSYSDFFEITKFDFGVKVESTDKSKDPKSGANVVDYRPAGRASTPPYSQQAQGQQGQKKQHSDKWYDWRAADDHGQLKEQLYRFEPKEFSFDRIIDRAS